MPHPSVLRVRVLTLLFLARLKSAEAVQFASAAVQPPISPIPCKTLNELIPACYPAPVFAAVHPRPLFPIFLRSRSSLILQTCKRVFCVPGAFAGCASRIPDAFSGPTSVPTLFSRRTDHCSPPAPRYCLKSFRCNTYGPPRKCCKQKTYALAKPFRCNTYKKPGGGACYC